jgi:hypothetical protein
MSAEHLIPDYSDLLQQLREAAGDPRGKLMQDEFVEHVRKLARAAATPVQAGAVPPGMRLVPVEPTEEMLLAASAADREYTKRNFGDVDVTYCQGGYDHWVAMLSAAPGSPPATIKDSSIVQPAKMRMLTEEEMLGVTGYTEHAGRLRAVLMGIQRKFCEVNGLPLEGDGNG